ncbi:membrane protein [Rhizocola hellebori]|uniref:Membrane protein n=1 Tax=Rhizocola hellebori TaxID=1392758 RepID=A0A8J3QD84_9ACTN|nr:glycosyltransferase 87 family protein [Rhizocola hellebori]GIH08580.1 membrane protein [Rhizocola hellebori]
MAGITRRHWIQVALLALAVTIFITMVPGKRGWFDVGVYYGTIHHWIHDGGLIYDYVRPGTHYGFTYPPFAALCMLPMLLFTWHQAVAVSVALTVAASAALLYWLVDPIAKRQGWNRWFTFVLAACLFAMLEPVRDTVSFGQVNLLLVALVYLDLWLLSTGRQRWAGIGIGLAAAIKLTPAIFIVYLLVTARRRPALVATAVAVTATLFAANVAPTESLVYWTDALWDTNRIGVLYYVSNQSVQGILARLHPPSPGGVFWAGAVLALLVVWARQARRAALAADDRAGFAVTGIVACLISPITWVHHLVWFIPALIVLADTGTRRHRLAAAAMYAVLCSSLVWLWAVHFSGIDGFLGSNAYVWVGLALLFLVPVPQPAELEVPERPNLAPQPALLGAGHHNGQL